VQSAWAACPAITLATLPIVSDIHYQPMQQNELAAVSRSVRHKFRQLWWVASYSALTRELGDNSSVVLEGPERGSDKLLPELFSEMQPAVLLDDNEDSAIQYQFVAGPQAGTFLHGILEWIGLQGFKHIIQQPELLTAELTKRCQLRGWQAGGDALEHWFIQLLTSRFSLPDREMDIVSCLAELEVYQVELEFWLPCQHIDIQQLDQLLQRHIWPGEARPALLAGQLNGMLKGFIDLVFCQQQRYVVCDYKSNRAGQYAGAYNELALRQIMLQKRYDLQAVLYCLALHRLLRSRLAHYDYDRDTAGAMHWFIRGIATAQHGIVWLKPSLQLINALDQLFRGDSANAG
jgi:exodeoxyribonuclease V beta subunit